MKKFGFLAFEGVADELQHPAQQEKDRGVKPQPVEENTGKEEHERKQNRGDSQGMASSVDRVLVASGVLCDPLLAGPSA